MSNVIGGDGYGSHEDCNPADALADLCAVPTETAPCPSTYGVLVCERPVVGLHGARLASGELVMWGDGCDETCTADCGHCKGRLRRDTESTHA